MAKNKKKEPEDVCVSSAGIGGFLYRVKYAGCIMYGCMAIRQERENKTG